MSRVYGFNEEGFRRVREATNRVLGTPRTGSQRRRQPPVLSGPTKAVIVKPIEDIEPGNVGRCDVYAGPLGLETATGATIFGYSHGSFLEAGKRCWAEHYSRLRGGQPRPLTSAELSSGFSSDATSSSLEDALCEYELFLADSC